jgi:hypothetical protein
MRPALRRWLRCYDRVVKADEIRAFARRDWAAVAETKARFWADRKRSMTPDEALAAADVLRQHARAVRPDWPDSRERDEDRAVHVRVSEALRAVSPVRSR